MLALALLPAAVPAQTHDSNAQAGLCPIPLDVPKRPTVDQALDPGDIYMKADQANFVKDGKSHLEGDVEITQDQKQVSADSIDYFQPSNSADLEGNVNYWDDQVYLRGPSAHVNFDNNTAEFSRANYRVLSNRGRGFAKELTVVSGKTTTGKGVDYTTCDPETAPGDFWDLDKNFWKISAGKIVLNQEKERGHATNVILRIKDVPIFYTPYISFPLSSKRKSGFLVPTLGSSSSGGFQISTPYYWNIEPQMDATVTPKYFTNRGVMGEGEYRYLFTKGHGQINLDYLPSDSAYNNHHRSSIHFEHDQSFLSTGRLSLLFNQVSDFHYFEDFGNSLSTASIRYLPREADFSYAGKGWQVYSRLQNYQIVDQSILTTSRPYSRLPQVILNVYPFTGQNRLNLRVDTQFDYFDRDTKVGFVNDVNGFRLDVYPKVSYPLSTQAAFLTPQLGLRYTQYYLGNSSLFSDSPSRLLPMASLKGGVFLERNISLFGENYLQTLEPNFYYLFVPGRNQSNLPIFDTSEYSLSYYSLFRDNRFSGPDRFGDANQITLALTSRMVQTKTGREQAYLRLGQIFYLAKQDVQREVLSATGSLVPVGTPPGDNYSPLVLEVGTDFFKDWHFDGELQWDPNDNSTQKLVFNAQYHPGEGKVLNLGYRIRRGAAGQVLRTTTNIDQSDLSFRWPINQRWSVVGRWNYAVPEGKSLDLFGGIEYESCCWGIRAVVRRYLTNLDGDFQTGFFIQLQLKGLAGLGQSTVNFLTQSIPGYHSEF